MSRNYILVFAFLLTLILPAEAQDYRVIRPSQPGLFYTQHLSPNRIQYDYAISIDSSQTMGSDTLHYNYRIVKPSNQPGCSYDFSQPSWLGDYFIERPGNQFIFFNSQQDSIFFQSNNLGTWKMMNLAGGNAVYANYSGTIQEMVNGNVMDSVRVFTLQVQDSAFLPIAHYLNGREWKVSKTLGLTQIMSFWEFPDTLTNQWGTLRRYDPGLIMEEQIWDFTVGDSMHIFEQKLDIQSDSRDYEEWVLISKNITPPTTALTFQIRHYRYWDDYTNPPNYTYFPISYQTITFDSGYDPIIEDQMPYACKDTNIAQLADPNVRPALFNYFNDYADRIQKHSYQPLFAGASTFNPNSNCFPIPDSTLASFNIMHYFWIQGLGGKYWEQDAINGGLHHFVRKPVWYHKGNQIWGTKLDFSGFVGIQDQLASSLQIYPQPMRETTQISLSEPIHGCQLTLHDLNGRLIYSKPMPSDGQIAITRNEVPRAGVYLVSLQTPSGAVARRKLVVQ